MLTVQKPIGVTHRFKEFCDAHLNDGFVRIGYGWKNRDGHGNNQYVFRAAAGGKTKLFHFHLEFSPFRTSLTIKRPVLVSSLKTGSDKSISFKMCLNWKKVQVWG